MSEGPEANTRLASVARRFGAALIDGFILFVLATIATSVAVPGLDDTENLTSGEETRIAVAMVIAISVWVNYIVVSEWRWGRTAGKAALDISVVSTRAAPVTWNRALIRTLLRVPDLVAFVLTVPRSPKGQRLGDMAARTMVVRGPRDEFEPGLEFEYPDSSHDHGGDDAQWQVLRPVDLLIGLGGVVFGLVFIAGIAAELVSREPDRTLIGLGIQDILFVVVPIGVAAMRLRKRPWETIGFRAFRASDLWLVGAAFVAQVAVTVLFSLFLFAPEQDSIANDIDFDKTAFAAVLTFLAIVVLAPVCEETLFRGLFFGALRGSLGFWPSALISGVLFGAIHLTNGDLSVAVLLAFFGVLLAWLYERTGSLGPPIALHTLNNSIAILPLLL